MRYLAVIHQGDQGTYGVSFPDVPGCISAGRTLDIALRNAGEALAFHFEGMAEDGEAPPSASDWPDAVAAVLAENVDPESLRGFHWVVPGVAEPDRSVRLNITLPQSLVDEIEAHVGERGRSGFLADSARSALDTRSATAMRNPLMHVWSAGHHTDGVQASGSGFVFLKPVTISGSWGEGKSHRMIPRKAASGVILGSDPLPRSRKGSA